MCETDTLHLLSQTVPISWKLENGTISENGDEKTKSRNKTQIKDIRVENKIKKKAENGQFDCH